MKKVYIAKTFDNIIAVFDHEPSDAEKKVCIRDNAMSGSTQYVSFKEYNVVSKHQESINEEELDRLAKDFLSEGYENNCNPDFMECCKNIYKAGYRKAKQE